MNYNDIEQALRDYYWMVSQVGRLERELNNIELTIVPPYGLEAAMPKSNQISDKVGKTVIKRDEESRYLKKLKGKIAFIDEGLKRIENDLEKAVMLCIMDGLSQFQIAQHFKISEGKVSSIKCHIVKGMNVLNDLKILTKQKC